MNRCLSFLSVVVLLASLPRSVRADIAPDPVTAGWPITPYQKESTDVRMVSEDVLVRIYADSVVTVASFSMFNEGATIEMPVGFPFAYEDDLVRFSATVDGQPAAIRVDETGHWKLWDVTFRKEKPCDTRVEYKANPERIFLGWFSGRHAPAIPASEIKTLRSITTQARVQYTLRTGQPWKGVLDHCRVAFELMEFTADHIQRAYPEDAVITDNRIVWEYTDYEPQGWVKIAYFPAMSKAQILETLRETMARYPDDSMLIEEAGRFCNIYLHRTDIQCEIYHSFLSRWDKPVPQLIEYAPGGRCRYNPDRGFIMVWSMANQLFKQYRENDELERGVDIAPKAAAMSQAILDSLATCSGQEESNGWVVQYATTLRDLCNDLIAKGRQH